MKKITEAQFRKQNAERRKVVANRLLQARVQMGMTQVALAHHAGIDRKTVNRIENGHFSPSIDTFLRLCRVLETKPSSIFAHQKGSQAQ
jgi:DNA-binding XRE family transcriptional regulator